jgi:hypothetical protein
MNWSWPNLGKNLSGDKLTSRAMFEFGASVIQTYSLHVQAPSPFCISEKWKRREIKTTRKGALNIVLKYFAENTKFVTPRVERIQLVLLCTWALCSCPYVLQNPAEYVVACKAIRLRQSDVSEEHASSVFRLEE